MSSSFINTFCFPCVVSCLVGVYLNNRREHQHKESINLVLFSTMYFTTGLALGAMGNQSSGHNVEYL